MSADHLRRTRDTLRTVFGHDAFRDGQEPVVAALLAGRSALAVFPTGGGKSLCYQLPALLLDGLTLVVSPLIALMKDQIDALTRRGVKAARLDSTLTADEYRRVMSELQAGGLRLLYVAPERLGNERFRQTLKRLKVAILAIDEAHCISEWGHNFRPDYLKLAALARELKVGRVLALTATATPAVVGDIARAFRIADADIVQTGFRRPNLHLCATPCPPEQKPELLRRRLRERPPGATIVYVTQQQTAEQVAAGLARDGFAAQAYHAGMPDEERHRVQDWFMAEPAAIVVATIAFGMGIDKANIRYVYHYNLPKTLENYAQEIGRAGRDGLPSVCELFACGADRVVLENFTFGDTPAPEAVRALTAEVLGLGPEFDVSTYELSARHDIRPLVVETLLTYLELEGVLEATTPFFSDYRFRPLRPSAEVLKKFDAPRAEFLRAVFRRAVKGKTWLSLDVAAAAAAIGQPRERIVSALNYLEEQGDLVLEVRGVRQGYRRLREVSDAAGLAARMAGRFAQRERRDIDRLRQVLEFAGKEGCRWRFLLDYFGEDLPSDCGHCDWCAGERPGPVPDDARAALTDAERETVRRVRAQGHAALASPRQAARFLCGLKSPATTRAKLTTGHPDFGALRDVPFEVVLRAAEGEGHTSGAGPG